MSENEGFDSPEDAIEAWEDANGVELDEDQFENLVHHLNLKAGQDGEEQAGEDPAVQAWETSFNNGVERLAQKLDRKLLKSEVEQLKDKLPADVDGDLDVLGVWNDTLGPDGDPYDQSTSNGRTKFMAELTNERHLEESPPPDTVKMPTDDAPREERQEFMAARMAGAEVAEPEQTEPA